MTAEPMDNAVPGWALPTPTIRQCELCLRRAPDVAVTLVKWRDPLDGQTFGKAARCQSHPECRARVEAFGEAWPVDDGSPATRPHAGEAGLGKRHSPTPATPIATATQGGSHDLAQPRGESGAGAEDALKGPAPASDPPPLDFG